MIVHNLYLHQQSRFTKDIGVSTFKSVVGTILTEQPMMVVRMNMNLFCYLIQFLPHIG